MKLTKDKIEQIADRYAPMIANDIWEVELDERYLEHYIVEAIFNAMSKEDYASYQKPTKIRSKKIRDSAKGESCTLRIPGICNGNPKTTVFAHLPGNKGTGTKNHDIFGVYSCSVCHDWMDNRIHAKGDAAFLNARGEMLRALMETQLKLVEKGLLKVT